MNICNALTLHGGYAFTWLPVLPVGAKNVKLYFDAAWRMKEGKGCFSGD